MLAKEKIDRPSLNVHNSQKNDVSNEKLWKDLREGKQKAIEDLYRYNYQVLYSYALKICRDKELSKDCVQELFVGLWEKREFLATVAKVRPYLLQSIWHLLIKKLKESELIIVEGTLYPLLTRLKNANLLSYNWKESTSGPPRKYFQLTEEGQSFLDGLLGAWNHLVGAVNQSTKKVKSTSNE